MADMQELIARLEAAEVGCGDLSLEVNLALEGGEALPKMANYTMEPYWAIRRPSANHLGGFVNAPNWPVTTSLDAALALAERVGWRPHSADFSIAGRCSWSVISVLPNIPFSDEDGRTWDGYGYKVASAKTPALALCIAILKAKAQGEGR